MAFPRNSLFLVVCTLVKQHLRDFLQSKEEEKTVNTVS